MKRIICITIRSELKKFFCSLFFKAHVYITISTIESLVWCEVFSCCSKMMFLWKSPSFLPLLLSSTWNFFFSVQHFVILTALNASSELCWDRRKKKQTILKKYHFSATRKCCTSDKRLDCWNSDMDERFWEQTTERLSLSLT